MTDLEFILAELLVFSVIYNDATWRTVSKLIRATNRNRTQTT